MENTSLEKAAALLGVPVESLLAYPSEIQNSMNTIMEMMEIHNEEEAANVYAELDKLRKKGDQDLALNEIAEAAGLAPEALSNLTEEQKNKLHIKYAISDDITAAAEEAQVLSELTSMAETLNLPLEHLSGLPFANQKQYYDMYQRKLQSVESEPELESELSAALLELAAHLLDVSLESLRDYPEDVQAEMIETVKTTDIHSEDDCRKARSELYNLWLKVILSEQLDDVAKALDMSADELRSLPLDVQNQLCGVYDFEQEEDTLADSLRAVLDAYREGGNNETDSV